MPAPAARPLVLAPLLGLLLAVPAAQATERVPPRWEGWTGTCANTGMCSVSTIVRTQNAWVDVRIVRDWLYEAQPMVRVTASGPFADKGKAEISLDGVEVDTLDLQHLKEQEKNLTPPEGFRPLGGQGFWYPEGPATQSLIGAMRGAATISLTLSLQPNEVKVDIPVAGLEDALAWLDSRQQRNVVHAGSTPQPKPLPGETPRGRNLRSPDALPPSIRAIWENKTYCSGVEPGLFPDLDGVSTPLDQQTTLYIIPCGAPSAYNANYVVFTQRKGENARQEYFAQMSDKGPVASDILFNARWNPVTLELESHYKASGSGNCGSWHLWRWTGTSFALKEEAVRQLCDQQEILADKWPSTWPLDSQPRAAE